jgi:hypothetical protein
MIDKYEVSFNHRYITIDIDAIYIYIYIYIYIWYIQKCHVFLTPDCAMTLQLQNKDELQHTCKCTRATIWQIFAGMKKDET